MPGPLLVAHEGDYVEVTLVNPATNTMPHNIDLHSANGARGGAAGEPALVELAPGKVSYRAAGEFTKHGKVFS
jgi:hypothetical protein